MLLRTFRATGIAFLLVGLFACVSCTQDPPSPTEEPAEDPHAHGSHAEELGPNGGHLLELVTTPEGTVSPYRAEWVHDDDTETITVYLLDEAGKVVQPLPVDQVVIEIWYTGLDPKDFILPAVVEEGAEPATENAEFQLSDPQLFSALQMSKNIDNTLKLQLDDKLYIALIEHHDHGHGHSHSHD